MDQTYEEIVEQAFKLDSELPLSNRDAKHARIVMKHIYLHAQNKVRLLSDYLSAKVERNEETVAVHGWGELVGAAKKFLSNPANTLEILVNYPIDNVNEHPLLASLSNVEGAVMVRQAKAPQLFNYMIGDDKIVRIESVKRNDHRAFASANLPDTAKKYAALFDAEFKQGNELYRNKAAQHYLY